MLGYFCSVGLIALGAMSVLAKNNNQHHNLRTTRVLEEDESGYDYIPKLPLYSGYGTRIMYMYMGKELQRQSLIVDTSSEVVTVPCKSMCKDCGEHTDPFYDMSKSPNASFPVCKNTKTQQKEEEEKKEAILDSAEGIIRRLKAKNDKVPEADSETSKSKSGARNKVQVPNNACTKTVKHEEGSSWTGVQVIDTCFPSGDHADEIDDANSLITEKFSFYCQQKNDGEFREQLANGVAGFNMGPNSVVSQMKRKGTLTKAIFALCFRMGGGILSLGGMDALMHKQPIQWAQGYNVQQNWGVNIESVEFESQSLTVGRVNVNGSAYGGKDGVIIDSSTTDTYLNIKVYTAFTKAFEKLTGVKYTTDDIKLTEEQLKKMPDIAFNLKAHQGSVPVKVVLNWQDYVQIVGKNKYGFRVYLTEKTGSILGVNFMSNKNVVFDLESKRIGFAVADCNADNMIYIREEDGDLAGDDDDGEEERFREGYGGINYYDDLLYYFEKDKRCGEIAFEDCSAKCDKPGPYIATGEQMFRDNCKQDGETYTKPCSENCNNFNIVRSSPQCPDTPWSECSHSCIMSRQTVPSTEKMFTKSGKKDVCNYQTQTSTCYTGMCPLHEGDYLVYADLRILIDQSKWSYVYSEALQSALATIFATKKVKPSNIEVLTDGVLRDTAWSKVHVQIHLKATDYQKPKHAGTPKDNDKYKSAVMEVHNAAEEITDFMHGEKFRKKLVKTLDAIATAFDKNTTSRFKWLTEYDVTLTSVVSVPMGNTRDMNADGQITGYHGSGTDYSVYEMMVIGVLCGLAVVAMVFVCLLVRLKREQSLLEKDKGSLKNMWKKFNNATADAKDKMLKVGQAITGKSEPMLTKEQYELELSRSSLMAEDDGSGENAL